MLNGLKNFAIKKVLRHVADNPKLNTATNRLALIPAVILAVLAINPDFGLVLQCCSKAGSLVEALKIGSCAASTVFMFACGKLRWLANWAPIADAIIGEAQKEIAAAAEPKA